MYWFGVHENAFHLPARRVLTVTPWLAISASYASFRKLQPLEAVEHPDRLGQDMRNLAFGLVLGKGDFDLIEVLWKHVVKFAQLVRNRQMMGQRIPVSGVFMAAPRFRGLAPVFLL